jgi:hypothetical protein
MTAHFDAVLRDAAVKTSRDPPAHYHSCQFKYFQSRVNTDLDLKNSPLSAHRRGKAIPRLRSGREAFCGSFARIGRQELDQVWGGNTMRNNFDSILRMALLLMFTTGIASAQRDQQPRILVVQGHSGHAEVIQKDGRAYVDLQSLTEIANGSLSFKGSRIVLSLPASNMGGSAAVETPAEPTHHPADDSGLSQDFMRAGIEEFATLREWASTMAYAIQNNYQITEDWAANYREQAANKLRLASAAAVTEGDRKALQLLNNEFDAVGQWSNKLVEARKSMDTAKYAMSPGALRNEALSQKIVTCGHFLAAMLGSGSFRDDPSCH